MKRLLGVLLSLTIIWGALICAPISASAAAPYVVNIFDGRNAAFALLSDGTVWGWGQNEFNQLLDGTTTNRNTPIQLDVNDVKAISGGGRATYALKKDGTVWAWGRNDFGQLGDGTTTDRNAPAQVKNLTGVVAPQPAN